MDYGGKNKDRAIEKNNNEIYDDAKDQNNNSNNNKKDKKDKTSRITKILIAMKIKLKTKMDKFVYFLHEKY